MYNNIITSVGELAALLPVGYVIVVQINGLFTPLEIAKH
jgi:hypothetical protein